MWADRARRRIATFKSGYLYRGNRIAGLGETGHHAYLTAEGLVPMNWHVSASARSPTDGWDRETAQESLVVTAGAFDDVSPPADRKPARQLELLSRPFQSFEPEDLFTIEHPGGVSFLVGARYVY